MSQQLIDRTIEIQGGISPHYVKAGEDRPLIIIPSWSLTGGWYQHQLRGLLHNRRVISLDMCGRGESCTLDNGYRLSRLVADLRAVTEALDIADVGLMGHSICSSIIWSYYGLFDDYRLGRMVFVNQAPSVSTKPNWSVEDIVTYGCPLPDLPAFAKSYLDVFGAETAEATVPLVARLFSPMISADEGGSYFICYGNPTKFNALADAFLV